MQYARRLHRLHPGKTEVRIFDYVDGSVPMLERMFRKRLRGYRAMGYAVEAAASDHYQCGGRRVGPVFEPADLLPYVERIGREGLDE